LLPNIDFKIISVNSLIGTKQLGEMLFSQANLRGLCRNIYSVSQSHEVHQNLNSWLLTPQNLRLCTSQLWELLYITFHPSVCFTEILVRWKTSKTSFIKTRWNSKQWSV